MGHIVLILSHRYTSRCGDLHRSRAYPHNVVLVLPALDIKRRLRSRAVSVRYLTRAQHAMTSLRYSIVFLVT